MGSFGIVIPTEDLSAPFAFIESQAGDAIDGSTALFIGLIAATAAIATVMLAIVSRDAFRLFQTRALFRCLTPAHLETNYRLLYRL
jgi:hypothetical protein